MASVIPAIGFLIAAAVIGGNGGGGGGGGGNFGGGSSRKKENEEPRPMRGETQKAPCDDYIHSIMFSMSGSNTLGSRTPLEGRGGFEVGFSFWNFEYDGMAAVGRLDALKYAAEKDFFAIFGGRLRYYPAGLVPTSGWTARPYGVATAAVGWNPKGPEAKMLEYGGGLDVGYGRKTTAYTVFGEWLWSHVNAGGQGIATIEDHWHAAPSIVIGLRIRIHQPDENAVLEPQETK